MAEKNYAHVVGQDVVNVIVLDPAETDPAEFAKALGEGELVALDSHPDESWGIGWKYVNGSPVSPRSQSLVVDRDTIPADDTTAAVVTYTDTEAPAEVIFSVNDLEHTVAVTGGVAELEVTAAQPMTIDVTVDAYPGAVVTITAEGA